MPHDEQHKAVVTRALEAADPAELDDVVADDYVENDPLPGQESGRSGFKDAVDTWRAAFPDLTCSVEDVIAEGDLAVARIVMTGTHEGDFLGVPATGRKVRITGTRLYRVLDGRIVEGWANTDLMGLMQQLGVVPSPPAPDPAAIPPAEHLTGAPSTPEANRELMTRFIEEVWNQGNLDAADEIFDARATSPSAPGLPPGGAGVKIIASMFRGAFPDYWMTIDYMVAEDDRVAARFSQGGTHEGDLFGIPPTGKTVRFTETGILRIADGKVVESWYEGDTMSLMQQLGVGG